MSFSFTSVLGAILGDSGYAGLFANGVDGFKSLLMILVAFVLLYLGIAKKFEPLLLVTIAFGMLLANLPGANMISNSDTEGLLHYFYYGIRCDIFPPLIFLGVGAMTDFGPLIARPSSLILGAAAQLGIFTAFIGALGLTLVPRLAQAAALGRTDLVRSRLDRAMLATSLLVLPAMALLTVLGPTLGVLLFREEAVGNYLLPLAAGVALTCWQAVLSGALNGVGRQKAAARNALLAAVAELGCTFFLMGLPGMGLMGYVAGFVLSAALGAWLNWRVVHKATGLKARVLAWCIAPGLAALLMGLVVRLLFQVLRAAGMGDLPNLAVCTVFGLVLYLAALQAQGVPFSGIFRRK